jgi:hypothetical protein
MVKIPVGETIAHSYNFAFGHFLRLLGITWAPLVVLIAYSLMITPGFLGNTIPLNDKQEIVRQSLRLLPFSLIIALFIRAMIANGVTGLALGDRPGATFVYFSVGLGVWRFVGAWLLVLLVMVVLIIGLCIALAIGFTVGGVAFAALAHGSVAAAGVGAIALFLFLLAFYAAIIYIAVRLTFLLPPVVVAEQKIDLARGWQLTKGNFWRIFIIGLAVFIPMIFISGVIFVFAYGTGFFVGMLDIIQLGLHQAKEEVIQQRLDAISGQMREQALRVWPYSALAGLITETIGYGLAYGASAFAYREITATPQNTGMQVQAGLRS